MNNTSRRLWGILVIAIGVIVGFNALDITNINIFFDGWWTLILIIPAISDIIRHGFKTNSLIMLLLGVGLLLNAQGIFRIAIISKLFLPAVLVLIGLSMIFRKPIKIEVGNNNNSNVE